MIYWQRIPFYNWDSLRYNLLTEIDRQGLIHTTEENVGVDLDWQQLMGQVPLLREFIETLGPEVSVGSVGLTRFRKTLTHDLRGKIVLPAMTAGRVRIELPLIGREHSHIVYYRAKIISRQQQPNGVIYYQCDDSQAEELARVQVMEPMFIRTDIPHRIEFSRQFLDRISVVIRTKQPMCEDLVSAAILEKNSDLRWVRTE